MNENGSGFNSQAKKKQGKENKTREKEIERA